MQASTRSGAVQRIGLGVALALIASSHTVRAASEHEAILRSGDTFFAQLSRIDDQWNVTFQTPAAPRTLAVADLVRWGGRVDVKGGPVIVLADGDDPGEAAAQECALRWKRQGRRVRIARPPQGLDFNDMLLVRAPSKEDGQ